MTNEEYILSVVTGTKCNKCMCKTCDENRKNNGSGKCNGCFDCGKYENPFCLLTGTTLFGDKIEDVKEISCPFCKELKNQIDTQLYYENKRKTNTKVLYKAALCVENYGYPDDPNWQTGNLVGIHHELNFCPVCGKMLNLNNLINTIRRKIRK